MNRENLIVAFFVFVMIVSAQAFTPPFELSYGMNKTQISKILDTKPIFADGYKELEKYYYYVTSKKLHGFSVKEIDCVFIGLKGLSHVGVSLKYVSDKYFSNLKKVYTKIYGEPTSEDYEEILEFTTVEWNNNNSHISIYYARELSYLCVVYDHNYFRKWMKQK